MAKLMLDDGKFLTLGPVRDRRRGSDRRREIRMAPRFASATLCVAAGPPVDAQIVDISRSGMGMTTPSRVLPGSTVVVVCGDLTITGTVCHCRERLAGEYATGVSITSVFDRGLGKEI